MAATKQTLEADVAELRQWLRDHKEELLRIQAEREDQERLRALLADLEQQCATKDYENQGLRNEVGELENQRHNLSRVLENLSKEIGDLEAKRAEAQVIETRLAELQTKKEEAKEIFQRAAEVRGEVAALSSEKDKIRESLGKLKEKAPVIKQAIEKLQNEKDEASKALIQLESQMEAIQKDHTAKKIEIMELASRKAVLENEVENLRSEVQETGKMKQQLKLMLREYERATTELKTLRKDRQNLEFYISELNAKKAVLEKEVKALEGSITGGVTADEDSLSAYADLLEKAPACLEKEAFSGPKGGEDERKALDELKRHLKEDGLIFSPRVIDAFHTSLKCHDINPITVLCGVSGTGKTLLPIRYAKVMGMHQMTMAVQPRWDSPQDMLGFYNYLEKEYKATELSRALIRMDPYNFQEEQYAMLNSKWAKDRLLLVLLDEMNLARTEYYFSDFLSKLEIRREVKKPSIAHERSQAELELDAGPGKNTFRIWPGNNILFVGTMNEDETTQTLSDKVLDRANVIRFGKPDEMGQTGPVNDNSQRVNEKYLPFRQWQGWIKGVDKNAEWHGQVSDWTSKLNSALDMVGRPFGHRVNQAIEQFVANYPRVDEEGRHKLAFADQVELKIIPKLRGIDLGDDKTNQCLGEVEAVLADLNDNELGGAFDSARQESESLGMFQWRGVTRKCIEDAV
ncbi:hypothetical protein [Desulfatibacillum aliphaticivorans]|uniref:hypothetical protein n=1 Tax=Desulfatibacillum aliphaticivorans TaxID=218208 RepID=UPI000428CD2D|nr:hypothetical protein [Desulfatibacillum aliphaticivorans]